MSKKVDDFNAGDRIELKLLEHSVHYLFNEINHDNTAECVKWIIYENLDPKEKVLTLYINSTGGDLYAAFGLIDVITSSKHPVRIIGIGSVMSAAFLIFAAGTKGERFAAKNTSFMCHQYSDTTEGKHHVLKANIKEGESCNQRMIDILKDVSGLTAAKVKSKLLPASDVYLTPQEALELGIVDTIL